MVTNRERLYHQQFILVSGMLGKYAETSGQYDFLQQQTIKMWRELEPKDALEQIVGWFYDGLAYGNWPWQHLG